MRRENVRHAVLLTLLFLTSARMSGSAASESARPSEPLYTAAKRCGACHDVIYKAWSDSAHARSAESAAYRESLSRISGPTARQGCVWCHAPTTLLTSDVGMEEPISREGVTCDFCHTVADVTMDAQGSPFVSRPGAVKRGPFDYAGGRVQGHETAYSTLHRNNPLLCAACHEYRNAQGVAVLSNYSEWKASGYPARGVACQDCHMALVPGTRAAGAPPRSGLRVVNLHRLVGGSAVSQLARGLDLTIDSVARGSGSASVTVSVTNAAAGHSIPGGLASKSLILEVGVETADGRLELRQERIYRRELKDDRGSVLELVSDMFLKSASVGADTRIRPGESRVERLTVSVPQGARAIAARLAYRDASDPRQGPVTTWITDVKRPL